MSEKHFEIIMSGRQMAALIAAVAGLALVAFGLGVTVGLLQPPGGPDQAAREPESRVVPEPDLVTASAPAAWAAFPQEALPTPVPQEPTPLPQPSPSPDLSPSPDPTLPPSPTPQQAMPTPPPQLPPTPSAEVQGPAGIWVQVGSLSQAQQGEGLKQRVVALGFALEQVVVSRATDGRYRVRLGPFPDEESAGRVIARIRTQGFPDAFLARE